MCEKSSSADPKVSAEGGQEVLPALEQRFPAAREAHGGADPHLHPREDPMPEQRDARSRL